MDTDHADDTKVPHQQSHGKVVHWHVVRQQHLAETVTTRLPSNLRPDDPRMQAFSYRWLLPVTQQRWRLRHSIGRSRKSYAAHTLHRFVCYRLGVIGNGIFIPMVMLNVNLYSAIVTKSLMHWSRFVQACRFPLREYSMVVDHFAPVAVTLTR